MRYFLMLLLAIGNIEAAFAADASVKKVVDGIQVTITDDPFKPVVTVDGPVMREGDVRSDVYLYVPAINRFRNDGKIVWHIQGSIMYRGDWRYYSNAYLLGGVSADRTLIERKVVSCYRRDCTVRESFDIFLSPEQVKAGTVNNVLQVKLSGRRGPDIMLSVSKLMLRVLEETMRSLPTQASHGSTGQ